MSTCKKLQPGHKAAAKALWLNAFPEDADGFCDFYFAQQYDKDTYYGLWEGDTLCAMVGVARAQIRLFDKAVDMPLLRGVATYSHLQGRGYAGQLLGYVLRQLKEAGYSAAMLKTFIHPFYEKHGFATCSYRSETTWPAAAGQGRFLYIRRVAEVDTHLAEQLLTCYDAYCKGKQLYLYRSRQDLYTALTMALEVYGGVLAVHLREGVADGYCIGYPKQEGSLYAEEAVPAGSGLAVFAQAAAELGCSAFTCKTFEKTGEPDAMIRLLDARAWLSHLPQGSSMPAMCIADPLFSENNGCFPETAQAEIRNTWQMQAVLTPGQAAAKLVAYGGRAAGIYEEY